AAKYQIHPTQINAWKREFLDKAESVFSKDHASAKDESKEKELYSKIGELQIQVDFLKKVLGKRVWKKSAGLFAHLIKSSAVTSNAVSSSCRVAVIISSPKGNPCTTSG